MNRESTHADSIRPVSVLNHGSEYEGESQVFFGSRRLLVIAVCVHNPDCSGVSSIFEHIQNKNRLWNYCGRVR